MLSILPWLISSLFTIKLIILEFQKLYTKQVSQLIWKKKSLSFNQNTG